MACHLEYFDIRGLFMSLGYVNNMGIDLNQGTIFDRTLSLEDRQLLEDAIQQSDTDSANGKLPGIVNLIQRVEALQDKYGVEHDHKHPTEAIVETMRENDLLIERYGLGTSVKRVSTHPHLHMGIKIYKP